MARNRRARTGVRGAKFHRPRPIGRLPQAQRPWRAHLPPSPDEVGHQIDARESLQCETRQHETVGPTVNARPSRAPAGTDRYHHGNLRRALLEHAVELARAGGPNAVTMRDVQRRAGVSNSAAYRHYADRDALLAAVTTYAEARLADTLTASLTAVPSRGSRRRKAMARLRATGQAYIDYALAEPGLFRTAFAPDPARPGHLGHSSLSQRGGDLASLIAPPAEAEGAEGQHHPFQILTRCIDDLVATGVLAPDRREGLDAAAWSAVHGLATLFLDGPLRALDPTQKQLVTDRLLDVIQYGISAATAPTAARRTPHARRHRSPAEARPPCDQGTPLRP